jgi:GDPmannose 4,6-dehydratase
MLQGKTVDDFVLATGKLHTVQDFVQQAFTAAGLNWEECVQFDSGLLSSVEPIAPCGNPAKAKLLLGWENTVPFESIVSRMVESEIRKLEL